MRTMQSSITKLHYMQCYYVVLLPDEALPIQIKT